MDSTLPVNARIFYK